MMPPQCMSLTEIQQQENIPYQTLYNWRIKYQAQGTLMPSQSSTNQWSSEMKLATIIETASFTEAQLSEYCRTKGIYPEQIAQWKTDCLSGFSQAQQQSKEEKKQIKKDQKKIKSLEKELTRKDKALAEAAALLVLQKKLQALYGGEEEGL